MVIETPRGSCVRRLPSGRVEFLSPVPCPYNYGESPGHRGGDGDALDVVLLGPRRPRGHRTSATVRGVVGFLDAGLEDHKILCAHEGVTFSTRGLRLFFTIYAASKTARYRARGTARRAQFLGIHLATPTDR